MAPSASPSRGISPEALRAFEPGLRRYFRRRVQACEVDDLVQEVFASLYSSRSEAPIENPQRYLFTVAAHMLAHRRRLPFAVPLSMDKGGFGHEELSPERLLLGRETLSRAIEIIETLPPRTRQAFVLHRFGEMTYSRIAKEMAISVSAVEKHIMAALRALLVVAEDD